MGVFFFVFVCLSIVTAMHIRIRDLEDEREEGPGDPSPGGGLVRDDSTKNAGRRKNERL